MRAPTIDSVTARAFEIPTDRPESDGTLAWDSTTIVVVESRSGETTGIGWSYTHEAAATLVRAMLADLVVGRSAWTPEDAWAAMVGAVRNIGRQGLVAAAISAVDISFWDLRSRLSERSLVDELGRHVSSVPAYGSGGFCSYAPDEVASQLGGWADAGMGWVKMKVGRHPAEDHERLAAAREAIGPDVGLMVDANGVFTRQEARRWAERYSEFDVCWFEEPVTSDDLHSLHALRSEVPAGMEITAGEYAWDPFRYQALIQAHAVDVPQIDVTRVGGFTGFRQAAAVCETAHLDVSTHTAPHLSAHAASATRRARHIEWFHDHVRIEHLLFDGALDVADGRVEPDRGRPGLGVELKEPDAQHYEIEP